MAEAQSFSKNIHYTNNSDLAGAIIKTYQFPVNGIFSNDKLTKEICLLEPFCSIAMEYNTDKLDTKNDVLYSCREIKGVQSCSASKVIGVNVCKNDTTCLAEFNKGEPSNTSSGDKLFYNCHSENLAHLMSDKDIFSHCVVTNENFVFFNSDIDKKCIYKTIIDFKANSFLKAYDESGVKIEKIEIPSYVEIFKGASINIYDSEEGGYYLSLFKNKDIEVLDIMAICGTGGQNIIRTTLCSNTAGITFTNIDNEKTPDYVRPKGNIGCSGVFTGDINGEQNRCNVYGIEQVREASGFFHSDITHKAVMTNCSAYSSEIFGLANF